MTDQRISTLAAFPSDLTLADLIEVVRSTTNYKATGAQILNGITAIQTDFVAIEMFSASETLDGQANDNIRHFVVPTFMNGKHLTTAYAYIDSVSSSGIVEVALRNFTNGNVDMFTSGHNLTIDVGELSTVTAANPPVINTSNYVVHSHDVLSVDLEVGGTGTGVFGLYVHLYFAP